MRSVLKVEKISSTHFVQEIYFGGAVVGLSRMFDQKGYELHVGVYSVEHLVTHGSCSISSAIGQETVAKLHHQLSAQSEESGDEVVCLEDAVDVHLRITNNVLPDKFQNPFPKSALADYAKNFEGLIDSEKT